MIFTWNKLRNVIAIFVLAAASFLFYNRDPWCYMFFPNLKTVTGEWDGANTMTMNLFSAIMFMLLIAAALMNYENWRKNHDLTSLALNVAISIFAPDFISRWCFGETTEKALDRPLTWLFLVATLLEFLWANRRKIQSFINPYS